MQVLSSVNSILGKVDRYADKLGLGIGLIEGIANSSPIKNGQGMSGLVTGAVNEVKISLGINPVPSGIDGYWGLKGQPAFWLWKATSPTSSWSAPTLIGGGLAIGAYVAKELGLDGHPMIKRIIDIAQKGGTGAFVSGVIGSFVLPGCPAGTYDKQPAQNDNSGRGNTNIVNPYYSFPR